MKNVFKKSFLAVFVALFCMIDINNLAYAATIGQKLTAPENGWTRYDDSYEMISYSTGWQDVKASQYYHGAIKSTHTSGSTASFKFNGTKIRIIADSNNDGTHTERQEITIDGITEYFTLARPAGYQYLVYEKIGLNSGDHEVVIKSLDNKASNLDAFDIDGTILPIQEEQPPQEQPPQEQPSNERAILTITLTTGLEKEFDLSKQEVDDFINWYSQKGQGVGLNQYAISKHDNNKGPFKSRKTYIIFDKVLTFEVDEYTLDANK